MLSTAMRTSLETIGLGALIAHVLELPDQIRTATEQMGREEANLRSAKEELKTRQARLKSGDELVAGKKLEGTVAEKEAQIHLITEPERNRVAIREEDVERAKRQLEYLHLQFNSHRAASRYAFACTGSQLGS